MKSNEPDPAHAMSRGETWEDLQLRRSGSRPRFDRLTDGAVLYVPVYKEEDLIGYLWASVDGKAANFLNFGSAGTEGENAKGAWIIRLLQAKKDGLTSLEALREWIGAPEDERAGSIPAGSSPQRIRGLQDLKRIANSQ